MPNDGQTSVKLATHGQQPTRTCAVVLKSRSYPLPVHLLGRDFLDHLGGSTAGQYFFPPEVAPPIYLQKSRAKPLSDLAFIGCLKRRSFGLLVQ